MRLGVIEPRPEQSAPTPVDAPAGPFHPRSLPPIDVPGLYVHVPFCFHKCHYCDFYSITRQTPERMERFVDLLLAEADQWTGALGPTCRPRTVFFGGGTPSLLPLEAMRRLLNGLKDRFDFSMLNEWTVEVNPATASLEYCSMLRELGVDRLSFGAQSFVREELAILERHHDPDDVVRSIGIARVAGFRRVNVDLIYAVPGQAIESWEFSLNSALALGTEHLSCYGLTYESNTPMAVKKRLGSIRAVEDDVELAMLHRTREILHARGYEAYEISNYAKPGEACRHNLLYWNGGSYVGLGPSAASHVEGRRWRNRPHLGEWETAVRAGGIPTTDIEHLSPRQRAGELAMLQLRLAPGIAFEEFGRQTGFDPREMWGDVLGRLRDVELIQLDEAGFRLTGKGINVADAIAGEFVEAG
jgi:oxygen-independent coproporphyrinogen III oxidase